MLYFVKHRLNQEHICLSKEISVLCMFLAKLVIVFLRSSSYLCAILNILSSNELYLQLRYKIKMTLVRRLHSFQVQVTMEVMSNFLYSTIQEGDSEKQPVN